jgi:molybdate/tungstate transport system permease protein
MATTHGRSRSGSLSRSTLVLAVVAVQLVAFSLTYAVGRPTWYAAVVICSAFGLGLASSEGVFGVAMATLGSLLLVALGVPLALFVARQSPSQVLAKAMDPAVQQVLFLGVYGPLLAALVSLSLGVPLAYHLARGFRGQLLVESLVDLPLVVPHSVAGIIVLFGFGEGGLFPGVGVFGTMAGMVLALTFVSAPYAVTASRAAFEAVDRRLSQAAQVHGASDWETFRRVTAPLAWRGMVTGGVLAWARSVSEFGAVVVVAYSVEFFSPLSFETVTAQHAPVFVYNTYLSGGLAESGAVAALLLAVSAGIFLLVRWVTSDATDLGGLV